MKRIIAFLMSLMLALSLCACQIPEVNAPTLDPTESVVTTEPTPSTDVTEPSTDATTEAITYDNLTEKTGIDVEYEYNADANLFVVSLIWTNKLTTATPFGGTYLLDVFQGDVELGSNDMKAEEFTTLLTAVEPGSAMTITLRFALTDNTTPVIVKFGDASTNTYFADFTYELTAVG